MPDWLDPLYEAAEMRAVDAWAIEDQGVPSLDLMERAGIGLARVAARAARPGPVRVVVGKGNNGGDGLVAARLLREDGHEVDVLSTAPLAELRGDALANLERLPGDPPEPFAAERLQGSGAVVDALLGTGFRGRLTGLFETVVADVNELGVPIVSIDLPTGVSADTPNVPGLAVEASMTVTLAAPKLPLVLPPAVAGVALLAAVGPAGILGGAVEATGIELALQTAGVVVALTFVAAPFYIRQAMAAFASLDRTLLDASRTLGASEARGFARVAIPAAMPGLAAGTALATGRALGEFGATLMFAGSFQGITQTVPLAIYDRFSTDFESALALSAVLVAVSAAILLSVKLAQGGEALGIASR
jgi:hydroxyethylthiazole kinase-like uncharacterized protein yjeF